jgi:hypothetical protein
MERLQSNGTLFIRQSAMVDEKGVIHPTPFSVPWHNSGNTTCLCSHPVPGLRCACSDYGSHLAPFMRKSRVL